MWTADNFRVSKRNRNWKCFLEFLKKPEKLKKVKLNCVGAKVVRYRSWAESETNPVEARKVETKRLWSNFEAQDFKNLVRNFASFWRKKILIGRKSRFSVFPINFVNFLSNFFFSRKKFFPLSPKTKKSASVSSRTKTTFSEFFHLIGFVTS